MPGLLSLGPSGTKRAGARLTGRRFVERDICMTEEISRRDFLKAVGGAAAVGAGLTAAQQAQAAPSNRRVSASEKITIGVVGLAGRGFGHHIQTFSQFPDVQIGAVCDVYDRHLDHAVAFTQGKAKGYKDFRRLVEQKDLDAVIVATPPHWHPLVTLAALEAGKDVLCEK